MLCTGTDTVCLVESRLTFAVSASSSTHQVPLDICANCFQGSKVQFSLCEQKTKADVLFGFWHVHARSLG